MKTEKTEKIDVPKFEGFECIGLALLHDKESRKNLYVLNNNGDGLDMANVSNTRSLCMAQIYYRKIKPKRIVLEATGEFRVPLGGEYYLSLGLPERANYIFAETAKREILRIVEE